MAAAGATRRRRLAWSRLVGLGPIDPGSNPGGPTNSALQTPVACEQ
jgi:hypothetical protein